MLYKTKVYKNQRTKEKQRALTYLKSESVCQCRPSDSRYHPYAEICARSLQVDHDKVINYLTELEKEKLKVENNFKDDFEGRVQNQGAGKGM